MSRIILVFGFLFTLTVGVNATTWSPKERTCPLCSHKGEYWAIGSYGGYIYHWESKYQYIYWPLTESPSVYCCTKCYFSVYMWDFNSVPEHKIEPLKKYLATVKTEKKHKDYLDIPMTTRLEIAENVYKILERDKEFWCRFYRVMGYHYDAKNIAKAKESRITALNIAKEMLLDTLYISQAKEILFIIAAMYNFIGEKDNALLYLNIASLLTYQNDKWEKEDAKETDKYLTELIKEYKEVIRKRK